MNDSCLFATDYHGARDRFEKLIAFIEATSPTFVFLGGDILPGGILFGGPLHPLHTDFIGGFLVPLFLSLRERMGPSYPSVFLIPGNDDPRIMEPSFLAGADTGAFTYLSQRMLEIGGFLLAGYPFVPPTPFGLKDWEKYDVSRFVDPGCTHPNEGWRTFPVRPDDVEFATIQEDLRELAGERDLERSVMLFHAPPYATMLDRAALDGVMIDHAPADTHVGSVAIARFIEERQPAVTLHGHIHESTRITGVWKERIGKTWSFQGAHDGPEAAVIRFRVSLPEDAERLLL
jgi:Icc-related predicted phosphoesterase